MWARVSWRIPIRKRSMRRHWRRRPGFWPSSNWNCLLRLLNNQQFDRFAARHKFKAELAQQYTIQSGARGIGPTASLHLPRKIEVIGIGEPGLVNHRNPK